MKLWKPAFRPPRTPVSRPVQIAEKSQVIAPPTKSELEIPRLEQLKTQLSSVDTAPAVEESKIKASPKEGITEKVKPPTREDKPEPKPKKYKVLKRRQRRRQSLSVAVSEEEEELLREFAASQEKTFSSWARETLFKAMGRKIPKRPT